MRFLLLMFSISIINGFLLDDKNSSLPGKQSYLTVSEFYGYKSKAEQDLDKVREQLISQKRIQAENLNLLATQLQGKLDAFEHKLLEKTSPTATYSTNLNLQQKYQELERKYDELKNSSKALQQKYESLNQKNVQLTHENNQIRQSLAKLENMSTETEKEISKLQNDSFTVHQQSLELEQFNATNYLLREVQQKTQTLDTKVNSLVNGEQTRKQDYKDLYNKLKSLNMTSQITTDDIKKKVYEIEKNYSSLAADIQKEQKASMQGIVNRTTLQFYELEERVNVSLCMKFEQITAILALGNNSAEMSALRECDNQIFSAMKRYVDDQLQPVILTACHKIGYDVGVGLLKFTEIKTVVGINYLSEYNSTGKFTCEVSGFYFISITIANTNRGVGIDIMVNSTSQEFFETTLGTASLVLKLNLNDEVWINHQTGYIYKESNLCLNIFKLSNHVS